MKQLNVMVVCRSLCYLVFSFLLIGGYLNHRLVVEAFNSNSHSLAHSTSSYHLNSRAQRRRICPSTPSYSSLPQSQRQNNLRNKASLSMSFDPSLLLSAFSFDHVDLLLSSFDVGGSVSSSFSQLADGIAHIRHSNAVIEPSSLVENPLLEGGRSLDPLGNDILIFLCATIGIVPLFKWLEASPVIGFLSAGLLMGPAGLRLFEDLSDLENLADFGVLFLLFEQGLELTVERLKALSKYAFGMGSLQVLLSTLCFFVFPFIGGVQFLEFFMGSDSNVVDITRLDEALVIGAALSLSSSAFVLKILQENEQLNTRLGAACLGVLLFQDIAVVPLLVLLPIIESSAGPMPLDVQVTLLVETFVKALFGIGGILLIGGRFVRFLFSMVAKTQSSETFVALCLLVAVGIGGLTDALGLSSTLGAFSAGTLLAESNYRAQIESDIKPFKGLLLGLFFLTTGASVDPGVISEQWPTVFALLGGLIFIKSVVVSLLGPFFGLTKSESVRTALLLSGGGEFAFVILTLGDKLDVLPNQLTKVLIGVVVLSMALTPYLAKLGDFLGAKIEEWEMTQGKDLEEGREIGVIADSLDTERKLHGGDMTDQVVICGYGSVGETVVRFLRSSFVSEVFSSRQEHSRNIEGEGDAGTGLAFASVSDARGYIAFDRDPVRVSDGYKRGVNIFYGDGSNPMVLATAGVEDPRAFVVTYEDGEQCSRAVERLRQAFPLVPITVRAASMEEQQHLFDKGATSVLNDARETAVRMGESILSDIGLDMGAINQIKTGVLNELLLGGTNTKTVITTEGAGLDNADGAATPEELRGIMNKSFLERSRNAVMDSKLSFLLSEAAKSLSDTIGSVRVLEPDRSIETLDDAWNDAFTMEEEGEELEGVVVCKMPSKEEREERLSLKSGGGNSEEEEGS